jgi:hypothetical protein
LPKCSPNGRIILAKGKLATILYDSAPRTQRYGFAHPNKDVIKMYKSKYTSKIITQNIHIFREAIQYPTQGCGVKKVHGTS